MQTDKNNKPQTAPTDNTRNTQQQPVTADRATEREEVSKEDDKQEEYTDVLESGLGIDE